MATSKSAISKRHLIIWATTLAMVALVVAWATYFYPSKTPSDKVDGFEMVSSTGKVAFDPSLVERTIRAQLRDPNSAKFGPMLAYRYHQSDGKLGTAVCGTVNATNEYGKYDEPKEFVFISNPISALIDPNTPDNRFVNTWKEYCTDSR